MVLGEVLCGRIKIWVDHLSPSKKSLECRVILPDGVWRCKTRFKAIRKPVGAFSCARWAVVRARVRKAEFGAFLRVVGFLLILVNDM